MVDISVIILSYNTSELTLKSIKAVIDSLNTSSGISWEIIVVDNKSSDESVKMIRELKSSKLHLIESNKNLGFGIANNLAVEKAKGRYVLLLNSDVIAQNIPFNVLVNYLDQTHDCAGLTVKVMLSSGEIDMACHRGFPTPWRSFCYFTGLEKLFRHIPVLNNIFAGYHLCHLPLHTHHTIDSPTAAFFLLKRNVFNEIGGFDPDFFFYGEDLDLAYRIAQRGYKIHYNPDYTVLHLKYQSGLHSKKNETTVQIRSHFYESMKIFYKKHYALHHSAFFNAIIYSGITFISKIRR